MDSPNNASTASEVNETHASPKESNYGTFVFAGFAVVSLIVCASKGFVPIYAIEAAAWGFLAWYCHNRTLSEDANVAILALAVLVAAFEGYSVGRARSGGSLTSNAENTSRSADAVRGFSSLAPVGNTDSTTTDPSTNTNDPKCPSAIPAGMKAIVLERAELEKVVGTKAELARGAYYEGTNEDLAFNRTPWELNYHLRNDTNVCLTQAELEVTVKYRDSSFKERHNVSFDPILSPNKERYNGLLLNRRTGEKSDPLVMEQWRITKAWGFKLSPSPQPSAATADAPSTTKEHVEHVKRSSPPESARKPQFNPCAREIAVGMDRAERHPKS